MRVQMLTSDSTYLLRYSMQLLTRESQRHSACEMLTFSLGEVFFIWEATHDEVLADMSCGVHEPWLCIVDYT